MNFRPKRQSQPELNLIPMIDVLIVLLIFLVLTTTFTHESVLKIQLPESSTQSAGADTGIEVAIDPEGRSFVDQVAVEPDSPDALMKALGAAATGRKDAVIVVRADRKTPHQAVMNVLDAASRLGVTRISFATQNVPVAGTR